MFGVRLASGGVGKSREGDQKVPVGRYGLGAPRTSTKFGVFVPIRYPSPEQTAAGFTGGNVGIHDPHRKMRWLGRWANPFDTTDGCVGLATDGEMNEIAAWPRRNQTAGIDILPTP